MSGQVLSAFSPSTVRVHRHHAPAEDEELVLVEHVLGDMPAAGLRVGIVRQEHHADAEVGILKQIVAHLRQLGPEKLVGNLGEDARAIAGLRIGVHGAAMDERAGAGERATQDQCSSAGR